MRDGFPWVERLRRMNGIPELMFRIRERVRRSGPARAQPPMHAPWPARGELTGPAQAQAHAIAQGRNSGLAMLHTTVPGPRLGAFTQDPLDGAEWPRGPAHRMRWSNRDPKPCWEHNRLLHLPALALVAPAQAQADLMAWLDAYPVGEGIAWASGIEVAHRLVVMLVLQGLLNDKGGQSEVLAASVADHVGWLRRFPSRFSSANNHRLAELCALWCAGALAGNPAEPQDRDELLALASVLLGSGLGGEQSAGYLASGLEWVLTAQVASGGQLGPEADAVLAQGAEVLIGLLHSGGRTLRWGDCDDGRVWMSALDGVQAPGSIVGAIGAWLGRGDLVPEMWVPDLRAHWLGLVDPGERRRALHSAGWTGLVRLVDGSAVVHLNVGALGLPPLYAHGHCDALALTLTLDGHPVLVDAGSHRYTGAPEWRAWLQSAQAHNTAWMTGSDQAEWRDPWLGTPRGSARLESLDLGGNALEAVYAGPWRHRRTVRLTQGELVVRDRVEGSKQATVGLGWLFDPRLDVAGGGGELSVSGVEGFAVTVQVQGEHGRVHRQRVRPGFGACSTAYGVLDDAAQWESTATGPAEWTTRVRWSGANPGQQG